MRCFRYVDNLLTECRDHGHAFREVDEEAQVDVPVRVLPSERRRRARDGSGRSRRGARRVEEFDMKRMPWREARALALYPRRKHGERFGPMLSLRTMSRHVLSDGANIVGLYLPGGEIMTQDHVREVERVTWGADPRATRLVRKLGLDGTTVVYQALQAARGDWESAEAALTANQRMLHAVELARGVVSAKLEDVR